MRSQKEMLVNRARRRGNPKAPRLLPVLARMLAATLLVAAWPPSIRAQTAPAAAQPPASPPSESQGAKAAATGTDAPTRGGFANAADFGFSTEASGLENAKSLQRAVDRGGTVVVSRPGIYKIADTVYLGSDTSVVFGNGVSLKKVDEQGAFTHVFLNKGALTRTYDHHIAIEGLNLMVNGVDVRNFKVFGLHGQVAFFYIKDLRIDHFRCLDLGSAQYGIHVCTFEDIIINDVIIKGAKDGVHLGTGQRFTISNGIFDTGDDAIALNAEDWAVGNPEVGWIENGVVENCHDLNEGRIGGFFCRLLAGAWVGWQAGMEVQNADTVVSRGRLYRVVAHPDGQFYKSVTPPTHESGIQTLDGIRWVMSQSNVTYTAGVRNVSFRDIFLEKPRAAFVVLFDTGRWSRSYYPGAQVPEQQQLTFDNVRVLYKQRTAFLSINTPVDVLTVCNSTFGNSAIDFHGIGEPLDSWKTKVNIYGCVFDHKGPMTLLSNSARNKEILLKTSSNIELGDNFSAKVSAGPGKITVQSDLTGLK